MSGPSPSCGASAPGVVSSAPARVPPPSRRSFGLASVEDPLWDRLETCARATADGCHSCVCADASVPARAWRAWRRALWHALGDAADRDDGGQAASWAVHHRDDSERDLQRPLLAEGGGAEAGSGPQSSAPSGTGATLATSETGAIGASSGSATARASRVASADGASSSGRDEERWASWREPGTGGAKVRPGPGADGPESRHLDGPLNARPESSSGAQSAFAACLCDGDAGAAEPPSIRPSGAKGERAGAAGSAVSCDGLRPAEGKTQTKTQMQESGAGTCEAPLESGPFRAAEVAASDGVEVTNQETAGAFAPTSLAASAPTRPEAATSTSLAAPMAASEGSVSVSAAAPSPAAAPSSSSLSPPPAAAPSSSSLSPPPAPPSPSSSSSALASSSSTPASVRPVPVPREPSRLGHYAHPDGEGGLEGALSRRPAASLGCGQCVVPGARGGLARDYALGRILGAGAHGSVRRAVRLLDGRPVAVKTVRKSGLAGPAGAAALRREVGVLRALGDHPCVANLLDVREDAEAVHLVLRLAEGGDALHRLAADARAGRPASERRIARVFRAMCAAVARCHAIGYVHRDVKLENFLAAERGPGGATLAADFGLAARYRPGRPLRAVVGTALYVAPEVLRGSYGPPADAWSLGVCLHVMLSGCPPFWGASEEEVFERVHAGRLHLEGREWRGVSRAARGLVAELLRRDPAQRPLPRKLLDHPWVRGDLAHAWPLSKGTFERLAELSALSRVRQVAIAVAEDNVSREVSEEVRSLFPGLGRCKRGVPPEAAARALRALGHDVDAETVRRILRAARLGVRVDAEHAETAGEDANDDARRSGSIGKERTRAAEAGAGGAGDGGVGGSAPATPAGRRAGGSAAGRAPPGGPSTACVSPQALHAARRALAGTDGHPAGGPRGAAGGVPAARGAADAASSSAGAPAAAEPRQARVGVRDLIAAGRRALERARRAMAWDRDEEDADEAAAEAGGLAGGVGALGGGPNTWEPIQADDDDLSAAAVLVQSVREREQEAERDAAQEAERRGKVDGEAPGGIGGGDDAGLLNETPAVKKEAVLTPAAKAKTHRVFVESPTLQDASSLSSWAVVGPHSSLGSGASSGSAKAPQGALLPGASPDGEGHASEGRSAAVGECDAPPRSASASASAHRAGLPAGSTPQREQRPLVALLPPSSSSSSSPLPSSSPASASPELLPWSDFAAAVLEWSPAGRALFVRALFRKLDVRRAGALTPQDLARSLERYGVGRVDVELAFGAADADGDGLVSADDWTAFMAANAGGLQEVARNILQADAHTASEHEHDHDKAEDKEKSGEDAHRKTNKAKRNAPRKNTTKAHEKRAH